jgi:histone H3/H4
MQRESWFQSAVAILNARSLVLSSLIIVAMFHTIRQAQRSVGTCIPRSAMLRVIKEIVDDIARGPMRLSLEACAALHLSAESYLLLFFELLYISL